VIQHRKRGSDHVFTANGQGYQARITVSDSGYRMKVAYHCDYAAMRDITGQKAHHDMRDMFDQATLQAADLRHIEQPLFDLPDTQGKSQGINER
jgi:hypothetical protein